MHCNEKPIQFGGMFLKRGASCARCSLIPETARAPHWNMGLLTDNKIGILKTSAGCINVRQCLFYNGMEASISIRASRTRGRFRRVSSDAHGLPHFMHTTAAIKWA